MRHRKWTAPMMLLTLLVTAACEDFSQPGGRGEIRWHLDRPAFTKESAEIPDTNDFILTITDSKGKTLFEGNYGESPETLEVEPGSYTVSIVSVPFTAPAFSRPQYGDEQVVVVGSGQKVSVKLQCTLLNAGIRLRVDTSFLSRFPDGVLYVLSEETRLMYSYKETRIAYCKPGDVSVLLYNQGKDETLFSRTLVVREILTVGLSASEDNPVTGSSVQVAVDTSKTWLDEVFVMGDGPGGDDGAIPVSEAAGHVGETDVWVYGYIVGGDLTAKGKTVRTEGLQKKTHLALAARSSVTEKASCVAVELPAGSIRDALNLVDHPDLIGTRVYMKGNLVESYFGTTGLKGVKDYRQEE